MAADAPLLQINSLTKRLGDRLVLDDVTFAIGSGNKIGIVGANGVGKSTLAKIVADVETADSGDISRSRGLRVSYVDQNPQFRPEDTIYLAIQPPVWMAEYDCSDYRERVVQMLTSLGVTGGLERKIETLSGGERRRLAIACALAAEADLLVLDEPTNHLDIEAIEWLEKALSRRRTTMLMVTHDRYFLQRVCTHIMEIDRAKAYIYQGNYSNYLRRRDERLNAESTEQQRIAGTLRREKLWVDRQPQARGGKAKYRLDRYEQLLDSVKRPAKLNTPKLDGTAGGYIGSKIFEAVDVSKSYGNRILLNSFNYVFSRGEKLGIVGQNGAGKSTFIKLLLGLVEPDSGHFDIGTTVRFGYYSQDGISFDSSKKVIDAVTEIAEHVVFDDGRTLTSQQFLQRFGFSPVDQQKYIYKLSGGERCRLHLATVLMRRPNFLVLDEPTNDIDLYTLCVLEDFIAGFDGCAIIISHDRYFLDNTVDHILVMPGDGTVKDFPGTYSEYRQQQSEAVRNITPVSISNSPACHRVKESRPVKMTYKERQEFDKLTTELDELNAEKQRLESIFNSPDGTTDIREVSARYEQLLDEIDLKELRWLELSEKT